MKKYWRFSPGFTPTGLNSRGFTLVELLVVVGLIGILTVAILTAFNPVTQIKKGRDARRKGDLLKIQSALELYRSDRAGYPYTAAFSVCDAPFTYGNSTYMQKIPCDPLGEKYTYSSDDGLTYTLYTCLEYVNDSGRDDVDGGGNDRCTTSAGRVSLTVKNP